MSYLGHVISAEGIHPDPTKLQGITDAPAPRNVSELCSYLGMLIYYNKFLPHCSSVLKPLYDLLHQDVKWTWGEPQVNAFAKSKEMLRSSEVLVHYQPDLKLFLECDANLTWLTRHRILIKKRIVTACGRAPIFKPFVLGNCLLRTPHHG